MLPYVSHKYIHAIELYIHADSVKNPGLYSMWVENVNRSRPTKFVPVKDSRICSEHFSADMFEEGHGEKAVLKPYAVPTVFKQHACRLVLYFVVLM